MIKFFRHIRKSLIEQNKMGKYFKYAIGEIILVVIGILIALSINNWNEKRIKNNLKHTYIKNLINDYKKDTLQLKSRIKTNKQTLKHIDSIISRLNNPSTTTSEILNIASNQNNSFGLRIVNSYNNSTHETLISSGNIDLFSSEFTHDLMELKRMQLTEYNVTEGNSTYYFETLNNYRSHFLLSNRINNKNLIDMLWKKVDVYKHLPIYINLQSQRHHAISRYIELTQKVIDKTEYLLNELNNEQKK